MRTSVKWVRLSAAALLVATCMAAAPAHAEGEGSTENEARMGFPPGVSSHSTTMTTQGRFSIPPGDDGEPSTGATQVRREEPSSRIRQNEPFFWSAFISRLQEQAQSLAHR